MVKKLVISTNRALWVKKRKGLTHTAVLPRRNASSNLVPHLEFVNHYVLPNCVMTNEKRIFMQDVLSAWAVDANGYSSH